MGVNQLWKLLDGVLERRSGGGSAEDYAELVREVDGKAVAVDLSVWVVGGRNSCGVGLGGWVR